MAASVASRSLCFFLYLLILDGAAIFFFTRGFLLTRTELSMFSNCSDISQGASSCLRSASSSNSEEFLSRDSAVDRTNRDASDKILLPEHSRLAGEPNAVQAQGSEENESQCWTRPVIKKAIILIIDALRFDFVAHSRNFAGEKKPWMDKLPILQQQIDEKHFAAQMFKFIADPPTATLQRLKGLTTGGLPTFIDVGHSFGAPAIVEDNLLLQLASSGKRVVMMGDDTWMQLFPTQFTESYPFPSFNVKDLHTVDDGVIQELFPALRRDNWDVLIGHFLGVDHVGHIFGVDSPVMPAKLEQYNKVIEDVIEVLRNSSQPGGLFEDTLLIVMGDHSQTLNGDHGGGTPEEVETGLFALATHHLSKSLLDSTFHSSCDMEDPISGCINTFPQLDFAATLSAILGVPFPFGSVGQVNLELFSLVAGNALSMTEISEGKQEALWPSLMLMEQYREVLCINSWQVRRYFQVYAQLTVTGFAPQDFARLEDLYTKAQNSSSEYDESGCHSSQSENMQATADIISIAMKSVARQVEAYQDYLSAAASLARSQWTQFGLEWMFLGFLLLIACIAVRAQALYNLCHSGPKTFDKLFSSKALLTGSLASAYLTAMLAVLLPILASTPFHSIFDHFSENLGSIFIGVMVVASLAAYFTSSQSVCFMRTSYASIDVKKAQENKEWGIFGKLNVRTVGASLFVAVHAVSLFSNSYIVAEGRVINFLLASSGILHLRDAVQAKSKVLQAVCFVALIWVMPELHSLALFKSVTAGESQVASDWVPSSLQDNLLLLQIMLTCLTILLPLGILSFLLYRKANQGLVWWPVALGVIMMYILIGVHWLTLDLASIGLLRIPDTLIQIGRLHLPRLIYTMTVLITLMAAILGKFCSRGLDSKVSYREILIMVGTALLAGGSGSVILLMGRKGPLLSLSAAIEVWFFLELQSGTLPCRRMKSRDSDSVGQVEAIEIKTPVPAIVDWSLIAMQLFFCTGHSCSFDGLHYSAAFIGFDDFGFFQQGVLLATETFGASHGFPVIGLPLLVLAVFASTSTAEFSENESIILEITKGYIWFGLLRAIIVSVTTACVSIHRRHLMVWGIFAPKYVFDVAGFLLVDVFILLASALYFFLQPRKLHKA